MAGFSFSSVAGLFGAALVGLVLQGTANADGPKGYAVGLLQVHDTAWMEEYRPKAVALVGKHGGRFIASHGNPTLLEGDHSLPSVLVIIEFPSVMAARAWYDDPENAPQIALRQTGAHLDLFLAEALE